MPVERVFTQPDAKEAEFLNTLRPRALDECIGQQQVRDQLRISLDAARLRGEPMDHVLLDGPPGLGKTTLAHIIANELGRAIRVTSGPAITRQGDLMSMLTQLERGDVLFIDEIHRLNKVVEEFLYPALEDFRVDYTTESGIGGRTINFKLHPFTLVGATTRAGMLSGALRDRFGIPLHLDFYENDELTEILTRSARMLEIDADQPALQRLAARSRGTPRIANRLLKRVRDYSTVRSDGRVTEKTVDDTMALMQVDTLGLDSLDYGYLRTLIEHYDGGPAGVEAISASMGQERDTLEDVVEPYLLQIGFVIRTPRGRMVRPVAFEHLGYDASRSKKADNSPGLFE